MSGLQSYATLPLLRERKLFASTDVADDRRMTEKIRAATQEVNAFTQREFEPSLETRTFDWEDPLYLGFRSQSLLTITSIVDGSNATITAAALIMEGNDQSSSSSFGPFFGASLDPTQGFFLFITTPKRCMKVTGVWGWHDDYMNAWHGSGVTVQDNPLSAGATSITTSTNSSATVDTWGRQWPATLNCGTVQIGHLIQVDSEWMRVIGYPDTTHLSVVRGVNGTTATTHAQGATISIYEPPRDIVDITARWASFLFKQDETDFGRTIMPTMGGTVTLPSGLPSDIPLTLISYRKSRVA